ncbi:hypothetical protein CPC08DRAFT_193536 [Agrocybe pediades]|nr:hypothetical protein CPC08DRAFT_193536 [Agrocybe pediades]
MVKGLARTMKRRRVTLKVIGWTHRYRRLHRLGHRPTNGSVEHETEEEIICFVFLFVSAVLVEPVSLSQRQRVVFLGYEIDCILFSDNDEGQ